MKFLFITSQSPFPPISGLRKKISVLIKNFNKKDMDVSIISFDNKMPISEFYKRNVFYIQKKPRFSIIFRLISAFLKEPFETVIYSYNKRELKEIITKFNPDYVFIDYIRIAHIFPVVKKYKVILNIDDPQSLKYKKMKKYIRDIENPFGEAINLFPATIQKILKINFVKKLLVSYEAKMMQKYERKWARLYKIVLTNSGNDKKYLNKIGIKNVKLLPPLIEIKEEKLKIEEKENYLLFVGKMDYAPNPDAVDYFINEIFPLIREKYPEIEFWIVGSNMNKEQKKKWEKEKNVKVIGRVPNLEPYYRKAKVFVCPLRFGTGIKVKILEAMQYGAPVVTTEIGAEGIGCVHNKHLLIARDEKDFAENILKLMCDKDLRNRIINDAFNFVKENYEACKWAEKLLKLYSEI